MMIRITSVFILASLLILSGCSNSTSEKEPADSDTTHTKQSRELGEAYSNSQSDISLRMPEKWILMEEANLKPAMGKFAINIFKSGTDAAEETPLHVHAKAKHSYVAIWPHGYGTELPASEYARLDTISNVPNFNFEVDYEESKALQLKNGATWAYFIVPKNPPEKWQEPGFIFAQIRTTNNSATCYDEQTGNKIPLKKCDFLQGDRYVRQGTLDRQERQTINQILESISLDSVKKETAAGDLIKIEKPLPNMDVNSPLTVKGEARGQWYFEGSFSVELVDASGSTLAETHAQAEGNWMTENFVPFEATLKFDAPDDERGQLIFHRANPPGKAENAMSWSQPVIFPPK